MASYNDYKSKLEKKYKKDKEEEKKPSITSTGTGGVSGTVSTGEFSSKRNKLEEKYGSYRDKLEKRYGGEGLSADSVNNWITKAQDLSKNYKPGDTSKYTTDYGAEYKNTVKSLLDESEDVYGYLRTHKDEIANYDDLLFSYNQLTDYLRAVRSQIDGVNDYYKQFYGENHYNSTNMSLGELYTRMLVGEDSDEGRIAYTTPDGQNVTWKSLYELKKAEAEYDQLSAKPDWEEKSAEFGNSSYTFGDGSVSDEDIIFQLSQTLMPHELEYALEDGYTEEQFNDIQAKREYISKKYGVDAVDNLYGEIKELGDLGNHFWYMQDMTDKEKAVFSYIYNTQGAEAAYAWVEPKTEAIKQRKYARLGSELGEEHPFWGSVLSVPVNIAGGVEYIADAVDYLVTGEEQYNSASQLSSSIRSEVSKQVEWEIGNWDAGAFLYNTGMSMADSAASSMMFGKLGGVVQGLSAAGQATNDALDRGMSQPQAFWNGFFAGVFECAFETWSISKFRALKDTPVSGLKDYAKNIAKSMLTNATEETATELANIAYDYFINADFSQIETSIRQYMAQGMSESDAKMQVAKETAIQVVESGASGALMGFGFGVVGNAYGAHDYNQKATAEGSRVMSNGGVDALKALANDVAGVSNSSITELSNKVTHDVTKKNAKNVGKLSFEVDSVRMEQNRADITNALIEKGVSKGKAKAYADALVEMNNEYYKGQSPFFLGTDKQWKKITGDDNAYSILRSIVTNENSSVNIRNLKHSLGRVGIATTETSARTAQNTDKAKAEGSVATTVKSVLNGKISTSEDGKSKLVSNGDEVSINGIAEIKMEKADGKTFGVPYLKVVDAEGNESVVSSRDVEYASQSDAILYESFVQMGLDPSMFEVYKNGFNEADFDANGMPAAQQYAIGYAEAVQYGRVGLEDELATSHFASQLNPAVMQSAYKNGAIAEKYKVDTQQERIDKAVAERKEIGKAKTKGEVHFDDAKIKKKTAHQNAGFAVAKRLANLGYEIHVFESHLENGKWVDDRGEPADNGFYRLSDGSIHIDLNAGAGVHSLMVYTLAHELVHDMKRQSPAEWKRFAELLAKRYNENRSADDPTMSELIKQKMADEDLSWEIAYEEVMANFCERFLTDGNLMERIAQLEETDSETANAIKRIVQKFINWLRNLFKDIDADSFAGNRMHEMKMASEQLAQELENAFFDTFAKTVDTRQWLGEATTDIIEVSDAVRHSYRSLAEAAGFVAVEQDGVRMWTRNGQKVNEVTVEDIEISPIGAMINYSLEKGDLGKGEDAKKLAYRQKKMFADICTMCCQTNDFSMTMQFVGSAVFTGMKANADKQYGTTYDFPSICTKTQAVIDAMSAKMVKLKRGLKSEEILAIYQEVFASGNPVPCPECYVFSRWIGIGGLLDNIYTYQTTFKKLGATKAAESYAEMYAKVSAYAAEQGITFGKAKGALAKKVTSEWAKLKEKVEKADNQGEKVKDADRKKLESLETMMTTVKAMSWLDGVYFAENPLDANGNPKKNAKVNPNYWVDEKVLFDLTKGEEFASKYKEAWAFRTTQGAGYGKAITPYAEAVLGEGILTTNNTNKTIKDKAAGKLSNPFLSQHGMMDKSAKNILDRARIKQKIQSFLGGQRFQSTSDARYENASDYLLAALEMQAMHGMVQVYTKVDGAVPAFNAWGFSINQSLMPLGGGLDANGKIIDTKVGGMNPSVAYKNREKHETAGTITIGVNDNHIHTLNADRNRDFVIPYHASGGKAELVTAFRMAQDKAMKKATFVRSTDYSTTQSDKVLSDEVLLWLGKTEEEIAHIKDVRKARLDILTRSNPNMDVVRGNRFLSALYDKFYGGEWDGVKVAKSKVESQIFPNEFWDKEVTYDESGKIVRDYLEYCEDLGFLHRFSGLRPSNGILIKTNGYDQNGQRVVLTDLAYANGTNDNPQDHYRRRTVDTIDDFFWKEITDRRMYGNDGRYLEQQIVTLNDTTVNTVTNFAKKNDGRQYDAVLSMETANKIAHGEVRFSLRKYSKQQVDSWKSSKKIVVYTDASQLLDFVNKAMTEKDYKAKMYFGMVDDTLAEAIKKATGYDFGGKNVTLRADNVRKVFKDHGDEAKEKPKKQEAIVADDFALIPYVIGNPDNITKEAYEWGDKKFPAATFKKEVDGRIITVFAVDSGASSLDLFVQTMYKGKKNESIASTVNANALTQTPEVPTGTALNERVPQNSNDVNTSGEKLYSRRATFSTEGMSEGDIDVANKVVGILKTYAGSSRYLSGYATYTDDRIAREVRTSSSDTVIDYAKSYITWVDPLDFIYATTTSAEFREQLKKEAGSLDIDRLRNETQPIHLTVDFEDGQIVGHEGRHRMLALSEAGIGKVPVIIDAHNDDRHHTKPIEFMSLKGQDFGQYRHGTDFLLYGMLPLSKRYADAVSDLFANEPKSGVRFSKRESLADALEGLAENDIERTKLEQYRAKIDQIEAEQSKLAELRKQIREMSFAKGSRDMDALRKLQEEANKTANRINIIDKQLFNLEATAPMKAVLEREKALSTKREKERMKEINKLYIDARKESHEKTMQRAKLQKLILDTSKWLTAPSKNDVKCPDILRVPFAEFIESINMDSKRLSRGGAETQNDLRIASSMDSLATAISKITKAQDPSAEDNQVQFDEGYLDLPQNFVENIRIMAESIKKIIPTGKYVMNEMTSDEMKSLAKIIRTLRHAIKEMTQLYANYRFANSQMLGESTVQSVDELGKRGERFRGAVNFLAWENGLPYYVFKRFGSAGESVFEELMDAQDKLAFLSNEIFEFKKKSFTDKESKAWSEDYHDLTLPNGNTIRLSTADAMSIYCLYQRDHAIGHFMGGGIVIVGEKKNGVERVDSETELDIEDIKAIIGTLNDRQIEVAKAIQGFMSTECAKWGNEVSYKRFLENMFTEPKYFPIETNDKSRPLKDPDAQATDLFRLLNISATKPLTEGANNQIVVRNIFDVFANHASDMAKLNAYGFALLDTMKWLNYSEKTTNDKGQIFLKSVRGSLEKAYGKVANSYLINLIKDINGRGNGTRENTFAMGMMRKAKVAAVAANLRVAFLQPTSYVRAEAVLPRKALATAMLHKPQIAKAKKYCGIALWKSFGFYDTNINKSVEAQIRGDDTVTDKIVNASLKGAEMGDAITLGYLWNACEYMVLQEGKLQKGTEEFNIEVGKRLREVVYASQVVDSTLTRSQIMRNKTGFSQMLTSFMSEPTLSYNMLLDAEEQFRADVKRGFSKKIVFKKHGKRIVRVMEAYIATQALASIMESLFDAVRDDDEDEEFIDKFLTAIPKNFLDNVNILTSIPMIADSANALVSLITGEPWFEPERLDVSYLTDAVDALKALKDLIVKGDESYYTVYGTIYKIAQAVSTNTGIPLGNAMRDVVAIWNSTAGEADPNLLIHRTDDAPDKDKFLQASIDGDADEVARYKERYGDEEKAINALKTAIKDRFTAGEIDSSTAINYLVSYAGMSEDKAYWQLDRWGYAIEAGSTEDYDKYDDFINGVKNGNAGTVIKQYIDNGVELDTLKTQLGKAYRDGELSEPSVRNALVNHFDMDEDDVYWQFDRWDYAKQHSSTEGYDKYGEFYTAVESGRNLKATINRYTDHGVEAKTLASQITSYFKPLYKEMSNAERANIKGYLLNAYTLLGKNRYEKSKDIDKWLIE